MHSFCLGFVPVPLRFFCQIVLIVRGHFPRWTTIILPFEMQCTKIRLGWTERHANVELLQVQGTVYSVQYSQFLGSVWSLKDFAKFCLCRFIADEACSSVATFKGVCSILEEEKPSAFLLENVDMETKKDSEDVPLEAPACSAGRLTTFVAPFSVVAVAILHDRWNFTLFNCSVTQYYVPPILKYLESNLHFSVFNGEWKSWNLNLGTWN